ncbi:MAG TPA: hypothetical protein VGB74_18830 [Actinoplanes sp.]
MTQAGSGEGAPSRTEAGRGVEQRLATTVQAYPGLQLIAVPAQFLRLPEEVEPPDELFGKPGRTSAIADFFGAGPGGNRLLRGGRLPDLGGPGPAGLVDEVYDVVRDLWSASGCRVDDATGLDGRLLVVRDPDGYVLTLARHGDDDPVLTVGSPPLPPQLLDRGLLGGLLSGLALGCLGPCAASLGTMRAFPSMAGRSLTYWGWLPLFILFTGVCLWRPETRRFGAGLLLGGALVGITVTAIVTG